MLNTYENKKETTATTIKSKRGSWTSLSVTMIKHEQLNIVSAHDCDFIKQQQTNVRICKILTYDRNSHIEKFKQNNNTIK